ncbi:MAG: hypothetical protein RIQ60_1429 [Pseudomonadota bacterium]|jgi:hypothetical protein
MSQLQPGPAVSLAELSIRSRARGGTRLATTAVTLGAATRHQADATPAAVTPAIATPAGAAQAVALGRPAVQPADTAHAGASGLASATAWWRHWPASLRLVVEPAPRAPLGLRVAELRSGRAAFDNSDVGPLVRLLLPPGTYQVLARRGRHERAYTLTLAPGARIELWLPLDDGARDD